MQQLTKEETEVYMNTKTTTGQVDAGVRRDFVWTISRYTLDYKQDGEFTIVKKIPIGKPQETEVGNWNADCSIEDAQNYIDKKYPGHLVLAVRENKISA